MSKTKIIGVAVVVLCVLLLLAVSAQAAELEFSKVGNKVTTKGGLAVFELAGAAVECETVGGSGTVTSAKEMKIEDHYEKCKALSTTTGIEVSAKVTACSFVFHPGSTVAIEKGCTVESGECIVEQSAKEPLEDISYDDLKTSETELESEEVVSIAGIKTKINSSCKSMGLEEGESKLTNDQQVQGVNANPPRKIKISGAGTATAKLIKLENNSGTEYLFKFPPVVSTALKTISCSTVKSEGKVTTETSTRLFFTTAVMTTLTFSGCKSTILGTNLTTAAVKATNCALFLSVTPGAGATPFIGSIGAEDYTTLTALCAFTAEVKNTTSTVTCTIGIRLRRTAATGVLYTTVTTTTTPTTVNVKLSTSGTNQTIIGYAAVMPTATCTTEIHEFGHTILTGESTLSSSTNVALVQG
jgi:hypothetical protein